MLNLIYFAAWPTTIGLFIFAFFEPTIAGYTFSGLSILIALYAINMYSIKADPDPEIWTPSEIEVIKKYHLSLVYPFGSQIISALINVVRLSSILWIPLLLIKHVWVPAAFLII